MDDGRLSGEVQKGDARAGGAAVWQLDWQGSDG